jgi:casein kinase II subunit beta
MDGDDDEEEEEEEEEEASSTRDLGQQRSLVPLSPAASSTRTSPSSLGVPFTPQEKSPISPGMYSASPVYSNDGGSRLRVVRQWVPRPEVSAGATH